MQQRRNQDISQRFARALFQEGAITFRFDEWIKLKRTQNGSVEEFKNSYPAYFERFPDLEEWLLEIWNDLPTVSAKEAFAQETDDRKRVYFEHIDPAEMMKMCKNKRLVHTYESNAKTWKHGAPEKGHVHHIYNLYSLPPSDLGIRGDIDIYAVQCFCPSTLKEHWIWVNHEVQRCREDAGEAIAWTCMTPFYVEDLLAIYRQGEGYVFKAKKGARRYEEPQHMMKEDYFRLITEET